MSKETSEVLVWSLPFNGKPDDWDTQATGYVKALFDDPLLPASADVTLDETVHADKLAQKALDCNFSAMSALTMAVSDFPVGKSYLACAKTAAFPRGLAKHIWSKLVVKFVPMSNVQIAKIRLVMAACK
jgi:hypothetical protein